jgi:hypothetical protein
MKIILAGINERAEYMRGLVRGVGRYWKREGKIAATHVAKPLSDFSITAASKIGLRLPKRIPNSLGETLSFRPL